MTIQLEPSVLPDAQTYTYISDYVEVIEIGELSNTVQGIANVINLSFSTAQPNVTVNVGDNKIWFNGFYTTGETEGFFYVEPPFGNDITNTPSVVYTFSSVPPRKYLYNVSQPQPTGVTVTHNFTVNYTAGGNTNFSIDRYVYPNVYSAYSFLLNYEWYSEE